MLSGQTDYDKVPDVTATLLIEDVYIFQTARDSFGLGDILIKHGLIERIAKDIKTPYDAKVLNLDSAYVYPAFIDGMGQLALPKPERDNERPRVRFPGHPPNDLAGITPETLASEKIEAGSKSLEAYREAGFAVAHTVPYGGMLPGQGAIISLTGDSPGEMIMKDAASLFFKFDGARGVYPGTVIGVMAKWRDLYRNAQYYKLNLDNYQSDPLGKQRPDSDKTLEALIPLTESQQLLFAEAPRAKDVYRALELQNEMGYKMVLSDVKQADPAMQALKNNQVQILLSTDLPKEEKKSDKKKKGKSDSGENENADGEKDPEREALQKRKEEAMKSYVSQAARLEENGVKFGLSLYSGKVSDLKKNLRRMIEAGLSEQAALEALTINNAKILGIDKVCGSLHEGKLANLIVCTDAYFNEDSNIKYLLIEGNVEEFEIKKKSDKKSMGDFKAILGDWSYEVVIMGEESTGLIKIRDKDGELQVTIDDDELEELIECNVISYEENVLKLDFTLEMQEAGVDVSLVLEMKEDSFSGTTTIQGMDPVNIEGRKISSPE